MIGANVTEFGADRTGNTIVTVAIQRAIDACHTAGGGTVVFPPGTYRSGTLMMKSRVTLHLEAGATLLASTDRADYPITASVVGIGLSYFIFGDNLEDVAITGRGVIDGSGSAFWTDEMINATALRPKEWRPRGMIFLRNCRNTLVRDVILRNSPFFTLWLMGCDIATITGVRILNPRNGPNTDAIDIDCSSNVHISDCHLDAGDDCIALKGDAIFLGRKKACEFITVTNCTMSSSACAIRVGYEGDAPIRNCTFSNLTITRTEIGIDIVSILPKNCPTILEGVQIDRILLDNIAMTDVARPIFIWLGRETPGDFTGHIRDISISRVIAEATNGCFIGGLPNHCVEDIHISQLKLIMHGSMADVPPTTPCVWGSGTTPWPIHAQNVTGLTVRDISIDWRHADGHWHHQLKTDNVTALTTADLTGLTPT